MEKESIKKDERKTGNAKKWEADKPTSLWTNQCNDHSTN